MANAPRKNEKTIKKEGGVADKAYKPSHTVQKGKPHYGLRNRGGSENQVVVANNVSVDLADIMEDNLHNAR